MGLAQNNIKSIVTIHDLIFKRLPETYKAIDRSIYDYKSKYSCTHSDKIVAISKSTKNDLIEFYNIDPNKIQVIYQSCNPIFYSDKDLSPQLETKLQSYKLPTEYLLYVGSVEPRKNLKLILEAYGQLQDKDIPPLVIIGKARSYKKIFNQMKSSSAIADKIIWIENLENNELLKEIYKKASILLYPSLYEGFGLPVAEALLTKTPVISSNISSLPEAGGPDTIYINPHKVEELSVAIQKVLSNTELQTRMKGRGYAYAMKNFDPLNISKQWMSCYEEVL
jgi:glycosyltransferase involved in cell wall biosynthesis